MSFKNSNAIATDLACRKTLRELKRHAKSLRHTDPMMKHITSFAVVTSSGALEREAKDIIADYVLSVKASAPLMKYVERTIRGSSANPSVHKIVKLLDNFEMGWGDKYKKLVDALPTINRQAITSLVNNRNSVAHGCSISVPFTDVLWQYYRSRNVIQELEKVLI